MQGFRVWEFGIRSLGVPLFEDSGLRVEGSGLRVYRVSGLGVRV